MSQQELLESSKKEDFLSFGKKGKSIIVKEGKNSVSFFGDRRTFFRCMPKGEPLLTVEFTKDKNLIKITDRKGIKGDVESLLYELRRHLLSVRFPEPADIIHIHNKRYLILETGKESKQYEWIWQYPDNEKEFKEFAEAVQSYVHTKEAIKYELSLQELVIELKGLNEEEREKRIHEEWQNFGSGDLAVLQKDQEGIIAYPLENQKRRLKILKDTLAKKALS